VARSIGQLGHPNHARIIREHATFGHGARYASPARAFLKVAAERTPPGRVRFSALRMGSRPRAIGHLAPCQLSFDAARMAAWSLEKT
jgi:hypothetical protein